MTIEISSIEGAKAICPTMLDLWMSHHFDVPLLSQTTGISGEVIQRMVNGLPVQREDAERVLIQLSALLHKECTLSTMYIPLIQPPVEENKSEVARFRQRVDAEYASCEWALTGIAQGTTRHEFIAKRMENMYAHLQELREKVGEEAAMQAMISLQDEAAKKVKHA